MPLRVRLGLLFALGTAVLVAVVGLGFLLQLRASLDATLDAGLQSRADALSDQFGGAGLGSLRLNLDEEPVQVLTSDGQVVASSSSLGGLPVLDAAQRTSVLSRGASAGSPLAFTAGGDEESTRFLATVLPDRADLLLVVGTGTDISDTADEHIEKGFYILGPIAVLVAGLGAWWLAGAALRPVERMRRQTAEISERDSGAHLAVPGTRDEIASLAVTMNGLLDRMRDALAHERGFVADAGHELRTPLATLRAELELAARPGRSHDDLAAAVRSAAEDTDRLIRLAEDLLLLARAAGGGPFLRMGSVDVGRLASDAARGAAVLADARGVDIVVESQERVTVAADPDRMRQALDNVLVNAVRHSPDHGRVVVTVTTDPAAGTATVAVDDDGPGFPEDFLPHAFERFRRADTARARAEGGTGLGLAIVHTIAHAHAGRVRATNRPTGGALVEIELPALPAPSPPDDATRRDRATRENTHATEADGPAGQRSGTEAGSAGSGLGAPSR